MQARMQGMQEISCIPDFVVFFVRDSGVSITLIFKNQRVTVDGNARKYLQKSTEILAPETSDELGERTVSASERTVNVRSRVLTVMISTAMSSVSTR